MRYTIGEFAYDAKNSQCIDIIYIDFIDFRVKKGKQYGRTHLHQ